MNEFEAALHQASRDTGRFLSAQVRSHARKEGWPRHLAAALHVSYSPSDGFGVKVHPSAENEAWGYEYGTQDRPPTAVIRKFHNRPGKAVEHLNQQLSKYFGGL